MGTRVAGSVQSICPLNNLNSFHSDDVLIQRDKRTLWERFCMYVFAKL